MKMINVIRFAGVVLLTLQGAMAFDVVPQIRNVKAFQQYPWGNKVYFSYEVEGDIAASAESGETPFLVIAAKDKTSGKMLFESADSCLFGDTGSAAGVHKVVWDVGAQGATINSANVALTVMYCDELYLVVDLSAGANASSYPVSYLGSVPSIGWTDEYKTTKLVLRRIPAGTFKMPGSFDVTLTQPFYMGVFEVTQKQYTLVMGSNPSRRNKGDALPVEGVSYNTTRGSSDGAKWPLSSAVDSTSFMGKLRARTGLNFDLPTEAQWEYACRAGTTTTYYWGDSMDDNYAWYHDNSSNTIHGVGTKTPNAWGLYDMSGNVLEWCLDWNGTLTYGTDPKGSSSGSQRVPRGGDYRCFASYCTSSYRNQSSSGPLFGYYDYCGIRLVRTQ